MERGGGEGNADYAACRGEGYVCVHPVQKRGVGAVLRVRDVCAQRASQYEWAGDGGNAPGSIMSNV